MKSIINPIVRFWKWWFTPRSNDPSVRYREHALRVLLPLIGILRIVAILNIYSGKSGEIIPNVPQYVFVLGYAIPVFFSFYFLIERKVGVSGLLFILHWYITDMINFPNAGYWHANFQISLVIQIILGALLLPSYMIFPFLLFQITTIGVWGNWLDKNYFVPPLLSTGQPVAIFRRTIITLAAQEAIILFIVRYLRLEMEKSLRLQQSTIFQLENEIEERSHLQKEREKYIDELNRKNSELESFTYTVSHDLRSPLVTIKGFIGMLNKDIQANHHKNIQNDLERIANATDKMDKLLSDLLELSRVGRIVNPPEEINLVNLVTEVLDTLNKRINSKNIVVDVSPNLPKVMADRIRLREVFENLIDNAAKYMGEQEKPQIEIGTYDQISEHVIFVKDNGIGIEEKYYTKIFKLFEQLNASSEGTGIGLALVKSIIDVHGGRVWVESNKTGSTFYFTIPDHKY